MPPDSPGSGIPVLLPNPKSLMYSNNRSSPILIPILAAPMFDDLLMMVSTGSTPYDS